MTLQEFVANHCPEGPAQLRRLILEKTGTDVPYAYVWKWCDPRRPCAVSVENASLLYKATGGKCSFDELMSLKTIRDKVKPNPRAFAKRKAERLRKRKAVAKVATPESKLRQARKRIAELERLLAEATDADASQVA